MTESLPNIRAFSFLKKPIAALEKNHHLVISDIMPSSNRKLNNRSNQENPGSTQQINDSNQTPQNFLKMYQFNIIDHDEQIRAPRMTNATSYTYSDKNKVPQRTSFGKLQDDKPDSEIISNGSASSKAVSETGSVESSQDCDNNNKDVTKSSEEAKYSPATFDLNQPTRRFSTPVSTAEDFLNTDVFKIATNSTSDRERVMDSLNNLNMSKISSVSASAKSSSGGPGRVKNRPGNLTRQQSNLCNKNSLQLQQVYLHKKPLSFPAVLRPTATNQSPNEPSSHHDGTNEYSTSEAGSPEQNGGQKISLSSSPTSPKYDSNVNPFPLAGGMPLTTNIVGEYTSINEMNQKEPTHEHWKPNNFTTNCMKCFDAFGTFFIPQRKRRHHCRYCGVIVCSSCLLLPEENTGEQINSSVSGPFASGTGPNQNGNLLTRTRSFYRPSETNETNNNNTEGTSDSASESNVSTHTNESVGGVLLDANANFIIPIFENITANNNQQKLNECFKYCRICKDCSERYKYFVNEFNNDKGNNSSLQMTSQNNPPSDAPFVIIENPYIKQYRLSNSHINGSGVDSRLANIERGRQMSGLSESDLKQPSVAADENSSTAAGDNGSTVPADWSWSSF